MTFLNPNLNPNLNLSPEEEDPALWDAACKSTLRRMVDGRIDAEFKSLAADMSALEIWRQRIRVARTARSRRREAAQTATFSIALDTWSAMCHQLAKCCLTHYGSRNRAHKALRIHRDTLAGHLRS